MRHMRALLCVHINRKKRKKNHNLICTPPCVFVRACDVTLLSGSAISDYLGLPVGSVVPMATALPSRSTKGSRSLSGFFAGALREWLGMPLAKLNSPRQWWCRCSAGADGGIIVASALRRLQFCFDCFMAVSLCFVLFFSCFIANAWTSKLQES